MPTVPSLCVSALWMEMLSKEESLTVEWILMLIQNQQPVISAGIRRGCEALGGAIYSNLWASPTWKWASKEPRITGKSCKGGVHASLVPTPSLQHIKDYWPSTSKMDEGDGSGRGGGRLTKKIHAAQDSSRFQIHSCVRVFFYMPFIALGAEKSQSNGLQRVQVQVISFWACVNTEVPIRYFGNAVGQLHGGNQSHK